MRASRLITAACLVLFASALAQADEGYRLDDQSAVYSVAAKDLDLTAEVTLEAWVQADAMASGGGRILDKSPPGTQQGYMLDTHPGNSLRLLNKTGMCTYAAKLPADKWTHVVGVFSAPTKTMKLYVNGKEAASLQGEFVPMTHSDEPLVLGADPDGGNRFHGRIRRAAIYGRALKPDEIAARAASAEAAAPAGVLGDWIFSSKPEAVIKPAAGTLQLRRSGGASMHMTPYRGKLLDEAAAPGAPLCLWYRQPAADWTEALPVGNGIMGAMVFGGVGLERIQFNEHTIWTGKPHSYAHEGAVKSLPEIRRLLQEGRQAQREALKLDPERKSKEARDKMQVYHQRQGEAQNLASREFMSIPLGQKSYQPCGDLWIDTNVGESVSAYRRWLDLESAACMTEYRADGTTFRREVFASHPDGMIVTQLTADKPGKIDCLLRVSSLHRDATVEANGNRIILRGQVEKDGIRFQSVAQVKAKGGKVVVEGEGLRVSGADTVEIRLVAASNFVNFRDITGDPAERCETTLQAAVGKSIDEIRRAQQADHQKLFGRAVLDLGRTAQADKPTDVRIAEFKKGDDPHLPVLTFQYGRYLLLGSSRAGGQPANLQGIWNDSLRPAWDSKYTVNINTEMNYWPSLPANLAECQTPLFDAMEDLVVSGRETAKVHYGAKGWVLHHNFDLWRGTAPINASDHGIWVTGGAWLCRQLWENYLFTGDRDFLAKRAYPIMKEASEFFLDFLVEDPLTGYLISGPSNSPEQGGLVMGPAMDHQIVRSLLVATAEAARVLKVDEPLAKRLDAAAKRIAPNLIGRHGQMQEWLEDVDDPNNQHRHVSHLWGIYPGADVTWRDADLFKAARQSLIYRGDAATGWSMGWKLNLWARFQDGDHAMVILSNLLTPIAAANGQGGMYPNLFDAHPPFQIDGNFGASAGIAEMLMQSHAGELHLLPALPKAWPKGSFKGLLARGGLSVDAAWAGGQLTEVKIVARNGGPVRVRLGEKTKEIQTHADKPTILNGRLEVQ